MSSTRTRPRPRNIRPLRAALLSLALGVSLAAISSPAEAAQTLTVNRTGDEPNAFPRDLRCDVDATAPGAQCTLRAAIGIADFFDDRDTIEFAIPGAGVHEIKPRSELPRITHPVLIDGYSQPGARFNRKGIEDGDDARLKVVLSGTKIGSSTFARGLWLESGSGGSEVRGLAINRFGLGIQFDESSTIVGNFIGTDASGMRARGNASQGLAGSGGGSTIGGVNPALRNVISANKLGGIVASGSVSVRGNYIGVGADGRSRLGNGQINGQGAIALGSASLIGGAGNASNVIAFNGGPGISVINQGGPNVITRNRIFANQGPAIDLGQNGPTANDRNDEDEGPNDLQNFPDVSTALAGKHKTLIRGSLDSLPGVGSCRIEIYSNPRHSRQARSFLAGQSVGTDAAGDANFEFKAGRVRPGTAITATAACDFGTSELSSPLRVKKRTAAAL